MADEASENSLSSFADFISCLNSGEADSRITCAVIFGWPVAHMKRCSNVGCSRFVLLIVSSVSVGVENLGKLDR